MIQANELRLGNWYLDYNGNTAKVRSVDFVSLEHDLYFINGVNSTLANSIGLSTNIIDSIKEFEKESPASWRHSDFNSLRIVETDGFFMLYKGPAGAICPVNSLHHLQNLIHSLSNKELTIQL